MEAPKRRSFGNSHENLPVSRAGKPAKRRCLMFAGLGLMGALQQIELTSAPYRIIRRIRVHKNQENTFKPALVTRKNSKSRVATLSGFINPRGVNA